VNNGSGNILLPDPDREARLIDALNSGDKFEVERAVQALAQLRSAWSIEKLRSLLQGADEELAKAAANALREIPGTRSTIALTSGFLSPSAEVRTWCAYLVGEMSLFGRRDDCLKVVTELTSLVHDSDGRVAREAVHALGKIGGDAVVFPLIDILSSPRSSAELRAYALHAPRRWSDQEIASFVSSISAIVRAYPEDLRREIRKQDIFQYAPGEIISLICPPDEQILPMFPSQPSTLLDFAQATQPSLSQDWRPYGERGDTVGHRLEVDPQLGKVLAKSGRGFHSALRHPPSDASLLRWPPYRYYEMVVKSSDLGLALHINVAVGDEDQTLLYGPAQRYGSNPEVPEKEFQIPLDERVCDGTWHSVILDLMGDVKEAGWPDFWSVRWLALHGEMKLYRVRGSNDLSALKESAIDPVHKTPRRAHLLDFNQEENMAGVSPDLYGRLRKALMDCGPFESNEQLRAVFAHPKLRPWKNSVPEAQTRADRVDRTVYELIERRNADKENALVLFVRVSSGRHDTAAECHHRLTEIAKELERTLSPPREATSAHPSVLDTETIAEIRELVREDQLEKALNTLLEAGANQNEVDQLIRRLNRVRGHERQGTLTGEEADAKYAKIADAVLDLISS
jgi:HEAT repeat protein